MLMACGQAPEDRLQRVRRICDSKAIEFEPAFLLDALEEEQNQGITIDTTQVYLTFQGHRLLLIDAPGHLDFLKNMTTAASSAKLAVLVIDALEGVRPQTVRHLQVLSVLSVTDVVVAVNKIDRLNYDCERFQEIAAHTRKIIEAQALSCAAIVPISALTGENIIESAPAQSAQLNWYFGQPLLPTLIGLSQPSAKPEAVAPLRLSVQDIYRFSDRRYLAGRVSSGMVSVGDSVSFSPSGKITTVKSIHKHPDTIDKASAGESIALTFTEQIFVERGEVLCRTDQPAPIVDTEIPLRLVWIGRQPFSPRNKYFAKIGTNETPCTIEIVNIVEASGTALTSPSEALLLSNGTVADVVVHCAKPVAFDSPEIGSDISNIVICSSLDTVACGTVQWRHQADAEGPTLQGAANSNVVGVRRKQRELKQGHRAAVLWITGLSGAGKSSLATALERDLFFDNHNVVVLDADFMRTTMCADLGFSREHRTENVRRIATAARLFLEAGSIVIVACISPYANDRSLAREIIGEDDFHEIFLFCPLEVCQQRDPKGLYQGMREGHIQSLPGLDAPYQPPCNPSLRLDSSSLRISEEVEQVIDHLRKSGVMTVTTRSSHLRHFDARSTFFEPDWDPLFVPVAEGLAVD